MDRARQTGSRTDWVLFGVLGLLWGSSFLFIKVGVETLPPFTLVTLRLVFAAMFLTAVVALTREPLPTSLATYRHLAVLGLLSICVPFSLIAWGEQRIDSGLAAILNSTVPLFAIVISGLALHDEPVTANRVGGLLVGLAGVATVMSRSFGSAGSSTEGELAVVIAAGSYALGAVYARRYLRGVRPVVTALGQIVLALLVTGPLALIAEQPLEVGLRPDALVAVVWLGVLGLGVAYLIYYRLIAHWGATRASLVTYVLPIVGVTLGAAFLGESVDLRIIAGTAIVIIGVALASLQSRDSIRGWRSRLGRLLELTR
jgi:drug/metabolite transporter (DMT)-like permease